MKILVIIVAAFATACLPDEQCDPDQRYADGVCYAIVPDAGAAAVDAAATAFVGFGATCARTADCPAATDFCAVQPGATQGYCTHTGCKADPGVCPPSWGCLDLSVYGAGLPAVCTEPAP